MEHPQDVHQRYFQRWLSEAKAKPSSPSDSRCDTKDRAAPPPVRAGMARRSPHVTHSIKACLQACLTNMCLSLTSERERKKEREELAFDAFFAATPDSARLQVMLELKVSESLFKGFFSKVFLSKFPISTLSSRLWKFATALAHSRSLFPLSSFVHLSSLPPTEPSSAHSVLSSRAATTKAPTIATPQKVRRPKNKLDMLDYAIGTRTQLHIHKNKLSKHLHTF